jgi:U1 small nuclear ribonucleoprotein
MTDRLPPNLLALFAPRPPLRWVPPSDHAPEQRKTAAVSGLAQFLPALAEYEREYEYHPTESWLEARDRKKREKAQQIEALVTEGPKNCAQTSRLTYRPLVGMVANFCGGKNRQPP